MPIVSKTQKMKEVPFTTRGEEKQVCLMEVTKDSETRMTASIVKQDPNA